MTSRPSSNHSSILISDALSEERDKQKNNRRRSSHRHGAGISTSRNTNVTMTNCFKVLSYIILYVMTGAYFILWVIACNHTGNDGRCFQKEWKIFGTYYWIPYRLIYSIVGTLLNLFIIIICLVFLLKYLVYANEKQIQEKIQKAQQKNQKTLNKYKKQPHKDIYQFFLEHYKKDREKEELFKLSSKHNNNNNNNPNNMSIIHESFCSKFWNHLKISWILITELFLSLFYIEYNEFNIMAMVALSYYLFSAILYFNINTSDHSDPINCHDKTYNVIRSDQIFFGIGSICNAFSIILPGMCINICQKWKCVYQDYYSPPELSLTFKGSIFEAGSTVSDMDNDHRPIAPNLHKSPKIDVTKAENLTFIQLRSVLNDSFIRVWIFLFFAVQLIIFIVQPIANHDDYRDTLNDLYDCKCVDVIHCNLPMECQKNAITFFTINELILRLFVPMTLITTLILVASFEKKFYLSRLDAVRYVISPSSISVILLITLCELYWWEQHKDAIVTAWSIVYGATAVLQCYIFVALLDIQDNAYRNRDRLYGFRMSEPLTYYGEGVIAIGIMIICLTCLVLEENETGYMNKTYIIVRGAGILLFNLIELIMLIPIRTISISPKYRNHFKKKGKKKYLRTFRWMCFLNICNIIYSLLFISDEFNVILRNYNIENSITMRCAFALSFGSIYFSIWGLSQLLPWIIPNEYESSTLYTYNPGIEQNSEMSYMTQYAQVDRSRLGINTDNNSYVSPPPLSNLTDFDSTKHKLNYHLRHYQNKEDRKNSYDGDISSLKIIESPKSSPKSVTNTKKPKQQRPKLKERKINFDNADNLDNLDNLDDIDDGTNNNIPERYDDIMKMFKNDDDNKQQTQMTDERE